MREIIIVGAGPAGSAAATHLARAGRDVLLLDHATFPRPKPCGDGISTHAIQELKTLGLGERIAQAAFYPTYHIHSIAPNHNVATIPPCPQHHQGFTAPRAQFDTLLYEHALASGAHYQQAHVTRPLLENNRVQGVVAQTNGQTREYRAALTIAADGAYSTIAAHLHGHTYSPAYRAIGLRAYANTPTNQNHTIHMHFLQPLLPGYAWIFPIGPNRVNIGLWTTIPRSKKLPAPLPVLLQAFLDHPHTRAWLGPAPTLEDPQSWILNCNSHTPFPRTSPGALLIGDAGAFINPATGAGIAPALTSARLAAHAAIAALQTNDDAPLHHFNQAWRQTLAPAAQRGYMLQQLILANPWALNFWNQRAATHPGLAALFANLLNQLT
jgi:menaquinone-9 beta-reductase